MSLYENFTVGELTVEKILNTPQTTAGVGTGGGTAATLSVAEYGNEVLHKTVITCDTLPVTITDDAGVAQYGGVKVYTFPEGATLTQVVRVEGTLTLGDTGTYINTWAGDVAIGTVTATTGATLTGTEANIMQSVAIAAATAKVGTVTAMSVATALTEAPQRVLDGRSTAVDAYLNFVVDDDASHTAGTGHFDGTITLLWSVL